MHVIAHGLVGRADLPVPAAWFGVAAAGVLVASFAALAAGWSEPRLQQARGRRLIRVPPAAEVALGALGVAVLAAVVFAGLAATAVPTENLAPTVVHVAFWVGIPVASLLLGDVFRLLSPWRAIGRAAGAAMRRFGGPAAAEPLPYPERLGRWPAAAGLFAFAVVELVWARGDDPRALAVLAVAYTFAQLVGMGIYGVEPWSRNGDAFGVYFGCFARLAPLGRAADGRLVLRPPVAAASGLSAAPGTVALLLVGIGATTFDGAKEGPLFGSVAPRLQDAFASAGLSKGAALELAFLAGLVGVVAVVAAIYGAGAAGIRHPGGARAFAHTLVPIAAAYLVAHSFSLLAYQGQALAPLVSDPLGNGSDLLGTAARGIDYGVVSTTEIWYVQVAALIAGHLAALVLAHDRAVALLGSARDATRSQVVMLSVMVTFTCPGLWQLSVANA